MEAKAIALIAELIAACGVPTAIRRIQTLDANDVTLGDLAALKRGSLADPDCHFYADTSVITGGEENHP